MSDLSRLDLLRFLERVQKQDLARTRRWIQEEQQRARAEAQRAAAPKAEPKTWRAYVPADARQTVELHRVECRIEHPELDTREITATEARKLREMGAEMSCQQCQASEAAP
ncbi:hypothetical protein [Streptomyces sp. NPDC005953]|uniref:hypothetical protein n=1 Tax=Streptomyces sp. NPDC005953 TaxID=3156719 RepID=UPI0033D84A38